MRFPDLSLSPASLAVTTVLAASCGLAALGWSASRPSIEDMPVVFEEVVVTAPAEPEIVTAGLRSLRSTWLLGETISLEAVLENHGDAPETVLPAGHYDLSVERLSSPSPMHLGGTSFLLLAEASEPAPVKLAPGATLSRSITLSPEAPFDVPGRYRIQGTWTGGERRVEIEAFELVIATSEALASHESARRNPGA